MDLPKVGVESKEPEKHMERAGWLLGDVFSCRRVTLSLLWMQTLA